MPKKAKKAKKLTKLDLLKMKLVQAVASTNRAEERAEKLVREIGGLNEAVTDQRKRLSEASSEIDRHVKRQRDLEAERDRIMRVVDQFTSIQITSPAATTQSLRKT